MEAIQRIRRDFDQPLRVEDLARDLGMSVSTFKAITHMSPLEFQNQEISDAVIEGNAVDCERLLNKAIVETLMALEERLYATIKQIRIGVLASTHELDLSRTASTELPHP